jgi:hypothetical protein
VIILEVESAVLRNLLERSLDPNETLSGEYIFCDFDGVRYRVNFLMAGHHREKRPSGVTIEIVIACWDQLKEFGAQETFQKLYGQYAVPATADKGITWTLAIKLDLQPLGEAERKALITLACRLKANLLGAPILWVAEQFANKSNFAPFEIPYRGASGESFFVTPTDQGASVTFRIRFNDPGDKVIGGVFFQELGGDVVRRKIPAVPVVKYSETVPGDLASFAAPTGDPKLFGYVTMVLQARQPGQEGRHGRHHPDVQELHPLPHEVRKGLPPLEDEGEDGRHARKARPGDPRAQAEDQENNHRQDHGAEVTQVRE